MIDNIFILATSIFFVVKGATLATKHAARLAENYNMSKYIVGFIIIAIISILPETFISISSAIEGIPEFGLGTLFGSNVADLTLVFSVILFVAGRGIRIKSEILKNNIIFPFILVIPLVLGLDGLYTRREGIALIILGVIFYYLAFKNDKHESLVVITPNNRMKNIFYLFFSMVLLLIGSHFTVTSASNIALTLGISPILIGMLVVGLGTTLPELIFSLKSIKKHNDSMAVGDILGTVLADATIVVGILALINPFYFPQKIVYSTGVFMVIASFILFYFMRSGRVLSRKEGGLLFLFWLGFVMVEFFINK